MSTLLIGGNGYLGGLVAAGLLAETDGTIVAPIRGTHSRETVVAPIVQELRCEGLADRTDIDRIVTVPFPSTADWSELDAVVETYAVDQIVHCAGSVDYFNAAVLHESNIVLTAKLLELAKRHAMSRFVFLSTAFSSGYSDRPVREALHDDAGTDPTEYTRTKREAEALVATSGIPYLIVRPSVVIGDSRDGRYGGKPYGLYQFWTAFERLLTDRYRETVHVISPRVQLQLLHQDAFKNAFLAALRHLPPNSIVNITSRPDTLPTSRALMQQFCERVARPHHIYFYNKLADVRGEIADKRMRMLLEFTSVNSEISSHAWRFETTALRSLLSLGLHFVDATLETVLTCQDRFVDRSPRIQAYLEKNRDLLAARPDTIEFGAA